MKTRALFHIRRGEVAMLNYELPALGSDSILVQNVACGICMMDINAFRGDIASEYPYGPVGHESVGKVVEVGPSVTSVRPGDWVVSNLFAEYTVLRAPIVNKTASVGLVLPDGCQDPSLWIVEPVACVVHGICNSHLMPGDRVAVVGTGFMGLIFLQVLSHSPVGDLWALDVSTERLALAQRCGALQTFNPNNPADGVRIQEASGRFDVVFECGATQSSLSVAEGLIRSGGTLVLFAWHHGRRTISASDWHLKGLRVLSITPAFPSFSETRNFHHAVALMTRGIVDLTPLITHRWRLDEAQTAFETASSGNPNYVKGVLLMNN